MKRKKSLSTNADFKKWQQKQALSRFSRPQMQSFQRMGRRVVTKPTQSRYTFNANKITSSTYRNTAGRFKAPGGRFNKMNSKKTTKTSFLQKLTSGGAKRIVGQKRNRDTYYNFDKSGNNKNTNYTKSDLSRVVWNKEQLEVIRIVNSRKNIFFTGAAGTGKSLLIQKIRQDLEEMYGGKDPHAVYVTATTGIASVGISGMTLHKALGIRTAKTYQQVKYYATKYKKNVWQSIKALIIDEVSMLSGEVFSAMEKVARDIRGNNLHFGGIQLILCGDFLQLAAIKSKWCFECKEWDECITNYVYLERIYRQKQKQFTDLLNRVRFGLVKDGDIALLRSRVNKHVGRDDIEPTKLYSTNVYVNRTNSEGLGKLSGREYKYVSLDVDDGTSKTEQLEKVLNNTQALPEVCLKAKAQVILVKNLSDELVNGSRGVIIGFKRATEHLDDVAENGIKDFVRHIHRTTNKGNKKEKWTELQARMKSDFITVPGNKYVPIVRFGNGQTREVGPEVFQVENFREGNKYRTQIPLKLAFALTVHKAQGLSIDFVEISMRNMFAKSMFYVALSRCRTLEGLCIRDFDPSQIKNVDKKVINFMTKVLPQSVPLHVRKPVMKRIKRY